jgi:hypothetical protein
MTIRSKLALSYLFLVVLAIGAATPLTSFHST